MFRKKWKVRLLGALGAWATGIALAGHAMADEDPLISPWRYSGFGTVGLVTDNNGEIATARDINRSPRQTQYDRKSTIWTMDTRIGGQVEYRINPDAELVAQAVWRDQPRNTIDKTIELAYVGWRPAPNVSMRLGRINYDAFLMSDHRNVGYAYTWVRPPIEFYAWIPLYSVDGVDAAWDIDDESGRWRIKAQGGASKLPIPMGGGPNNIFEFAGNNLHGISVTRSQGPWRFKAAISEFTIGREAEPLNELHAGLETVAALKIPGVDISAINADAGYLRKQVSFQGTKMTYSTLGAVFDDGVWWAQAETGRTASTATIAPRSRMAYLGVGRRFDDWMPFVTYATIRPSEDVIKAKVDWSPLGLKSLRDRAYFTANATRTEQDTWSLGTRWEFSSQAALKLQFDMTRFKPEGYGGGVSRAPRLDKTESRVNVLSLTVDFVF